MSEEREAHKSKCSAHLRVKGKPYPRTCGECGLGPCKFIASALMAQAMDSEQADHQSLGWAKPTKPLTTPDAIKDSSPKVSQDDGLAYEIWASAQTPPGDCIENAVARIQALLERAHAKEE